MMVPFLRAMLLVAASGSSALAFAPTVLTLSHKFSSRHSIRSPSSGLKARSSENADARTWLEGFNTMAKKNAVVSSFTNRMPVFVPEAVDSATASRTFTPDDFACELERDRTILVGKVVTEDGKGWATSRLYDGASVAAVVNGRSFGVVMNDGGVASRKLAPICMASIDAFKLPVGLNVYTTRGPRSSLSEKEDSKGFGAPKMANRENLPRGDATHTRETPPHTDEQDALAISTCGLKRWRVYAPRELKGEVELEVGPYALGKKEHRLELSTLDEPLIDVVMKPGDALFIPAGFPHETFAEGTESAVHLTFGLMAVPWGLTFETLWKLSRIVQQSSAEHPDGQSDEALLESLDASTRARLQAPLPLGFVEDRRSILERMKSLEKAIAAPGSGVTEENLGASIDFLDFHRASLNEALLGAYSESLLHGAVPYAKRADKNLQVLADLLEAVSF